MADPARGRATYADVLNAQPHVVAEVLFVRRGPGGWMILERTRASPRRAHRRPRARRLAAGALAGGSRRSYFELAPDWVCEVPTASVDGDAPARLRPPGALEFPVAALWMR
jgi:hypothetical protein